MRVGLLSGTFDPVHAGHIELARLARDRLDLDQVWLLPERQPRGKKNVTPYLHRLAMLEAAAKDDFIRIVEVSGDSHSIATLAEISGGQEIYILTGADVDVSTWDSIDEIRSLANIVSFGRNGLGADIELSHQASSKTIRELITSDKKPNNLDARVLEYIYEHKLYQS